MILNIGDLIIKKDGVHMVIAKYPVRYLENVSDNHYKFWEIILNLGTDFVTRWGKIGTEGNTQRKKFPSKAHCEKEIQKIVADKLSNGYVEKTTNDSFMYRFSTQSKDAAFISSVDLEKFLKKENARIQKAK